MDESSFDVSVDDIVAVSELAESFEIAHDHRAGIVEDLQQLIKDVENHRNSPLVGFVLFLEPDRTTIHYLGDKIEWDHVHEAQSALRDAAKAKYQMWKVYGDKPKRPDEYVVEGSIQRKALARQEMQKQAARQAEYAYMCKHCGKGHRTSRGRDQHENLQKKRGCIKCGAPRCSVKNGSYDYTNDYKGILTCRACKESTG